MPMFSVSFRAVAPVPAQRVVALQTLSRILERRRIALDQGKRPVPLVRVLEDEVFDSVCYGLYGVLPILPW